MGDYDLVFGASQFARRSKGAHKTSAVVLVPEVGIEPTRPKTEDFKSSDGSGLSGSIVPTAVKTNELRRSRERVEPHGLRRGSIVLHKESASRQYPLCYPL